MSSLKAVSQDKLVYQFKIQIEESNPAIYRTVQVPANITFHAFHHIIQKAFNWHNEHLYEFAFVLHKNTRYVITMSADEMNEQVDIETISEHGEQYMLIPSVFTAPTLGDVKIKRPKTLEDYQQLPIEYLYFCRDLNSSDHQLSDFVRVGQIFEYCYDFGDHWEHQILCEGLFVRQKNVRYPICIDGQGNHLFENVGGIHGYYDALDIFNDVNHETHQHFTAWLVECYGRAIKHYDPNYFDASKVKLK